MLEISGYQIFLLIVLIAWPFVIGGMLFAMSRVQDNIERSDATTPEEAGLEPVTGKAPDREVTIVFGDEVVSSSEK
jgi:hypothetical protein